MAYRTDPRLAQARFGAAAAYDEGLRSYLLAVFNYMGVGLAITGVVAFVVGTTPALYGPILFSPLRWVVIFAPLLFVFFMSARMGSMSVSGAQIAFWLFSGLMGLAFAFGWTPCIGPVLGTILTMSASSASLGTGTALLAVYSLGLGVPFLLAALFTDLLLERLRLLSRTGRRLQRAAGAALAVAGVLMLTGQLETLANWLIETFPGFTRIG